MPSLRLFVSGSRHLRDSDAPYPTPIFTDQKALLLGGQATGRVTGQGHVAISDRAGLNLLLSAAPVTPGGGRQHEVSLMAWTGQTLETVRGTPPWGAGWERHSSPHPTRRPLLENPQRRGKASLCFDPD